MSTAARLPFNAGTNALAAHKPSGKSLTMSRSLGIGFLVVGAWRVARA